MLKDKEKYMKTSMIVSVREKCGLEKPPAEYTESINESINSMLKKSMGVGKLTGKRHRSTNQI